MKYSKNNKQNKQDKHENGFPDIPDDEFEKMRNNLGKKMKNENTSPKKKKKTK